MLRTIEALARGSGVVVGIGSAIDGDAAEASAMAATSSGLGKVRVYRSEDALVGALMDGDIGGAVRGTLDASRLFPVLKEACGSGPTGRAAMLERGDGGALLLVPVAIDEGRDLEERWRLLAAAASTVSALGEEPRVAILSKGRAGDASRGEDIARSLEECRALRERCEEAGITAICSEVLVERAVDEGNVLVAPDGVSGNLMFRVMHYLGGMEAWGALALHLLPRVYVDTSRARVDYLGAIKWAMATAAEGFRQP